VFFLSSESIDGLKSASTNKADINIQSITLHCNWEDEWEKAGIKCKTFFIIRKLKKNINECINKNSFPFFFHNF
jgi:hypothetical protein